MITGYTTHKLNEVRTYYNTNPFIVGVNGVTVIDSNLTGQTPYNKIEYRVNDDPLNNIYYKTSFTTLPNNEYVVKYNNTDTVTTFSTNLQSESFIEMNSIKEESKIGMVFPPKVENEIFIDRGSFSVLEPHYRLSEVSTLSELENYKNGYYKINKIN